MPWRGSRRNEANGMPLRCRPVTPRFGLLALDVDGTLIGAEEEPSARVRVAIAQARASGIRVCLCTGRPLAATKRYVSLLGLTTPPVVFNGALIPSLDGTGCPFLSRPLPHGVIDALIDAAHRLDAYLELHTANSYYVEDLSYAGEYQAHKLGVAPKVGPFDGPWRQEPMLKAQFVLRDEGQRQELEKIGPTIASKAILSWAVSPGFDGHYVNVMRPGVDKSSSLDRLLEALGIPWERVFAAGDSPSDLGYVRRAGYGVIMGNAPLSTRDSAPRVAPSVGEDGLARVIEQVVLGGRRRDAGVSLMLRTL